MFELRNQTSKASYDVPFSPPSVQMELDGTRYGRLFLKQCGVLAILALLNTLFESQWPPAQLFHNIVEASRLPVAQSCRSSFRS